MARAPRISDILTTANLVSGVGSILLATQGHLTIACWLVFAGALFDVFDGLAARAFGGGSELGKQLDSLADIVTFGLAPGMIIWSTYLQLIDARIPWALPAVVIVIAIASCWRLAKFNIDTRQAMGFLGLPTPSNGLFWTSVVMVHLGVATFNGPGATALANLFSQLLFQPALTLVAATLLGALMLSEIPLPGLKFKHFRWKGNEVIFVIVVLAVVLFALYGIMAFPLIVIIYLLSPLWGRAFASGTRNEVP
jgi:CDP-diacylglycerol---serine O-phosphatidyltransferase